MRAQVKKSDKVHLLKVKEAMSSLTSRLLRILKRRICYFQIAFGYYFANINVDAATI